MHANYFEGILQLRKPSKELLAFVLGAIENSPEVQVAKQEKIKAGIDIYLSSNAFLKNFSKSLAKRFQGEMKTTYTLHTRKQGKDVYRMTVMFRLAPFKETEIIEFRGNRYRVVKIGEKVELKDMQTGKKRLVKFRELEGNFRKPED